MSTFDMSSLFRKCAYCGKDVSVPDPKTYHWQLSIKNRKVYACGYTCYNKLKGKS